jgi:hypothetical protein
MAKINSLKNTLAKNAKARTTRVKKAKAPNRGQEKRCVDNFRHLGISEVLTPLGYIDLMTTDYILEFKVYTKAKDALGQILCYDHFIFPKRKLLIVLFGKGLSTWKGYDVFERLCSLYNVNVFKLSHVAKYNELKLLISNK